MGLTWKNKNDWDINNQAGYTQNLDQPDKDDILKMVRDMFQDAYVKKYNTNYNPTINNANANLNQDVAFMSLPLDDAPTDLADYRVSVKIPYFKINYAAANATAGNVIVGVNIYNASNALVDSWSQLQGLNNVAGDYESSFGFSFIPSVKLAKDFTIRVIVRLTTVVTTETLTFSTGLSQVSAERLGTVIEHIIL